MYDKPLQRKTLVRFNPETVLNVVREFKEGAEKSYQEDCEKLIDDYLNVSWTTEQYTTLFDMNLCSMLTLKKRENSKTLSLW